MKWRLLSAFRRPTEKVRLTAISASGDDSHPRLVRKPAKKFSPLRRQRSESLSGSSGSGGGGGSRKRRNAFASRSSRLGRQLSQAVADRNSTKVREILESAPDLDEFDEAQDVLHLACENTDLSTVAVLLRYGAMVNTLGGRDSAPIHIAARRNCLGIASLLLSHGSYPNIGTKFEKRTPLHIASTLGNNEMVRFLLENNAKVDQGDIYGSTALHMAARMGHLAVTRTLLDSGAGVDTYNNDGWTALHLAAESGNIAVVRLLIERRANVDSQNRFGRTPLHWATTCGHAQVVELLIRHNSSVTIVDVHGKTALDHAANDRVRTAIKAALSKDADAASAEAGASSFSGECGGGRRSLAFEGRSRRELSSLGQLSRQTLEEEEEEEEEDGEERRGGEGGGEERKRSHPSVFSAWRSRIEAEPRFARADIRSFRSWTDCRSTGTDSGRGSSITNSSIWGTLPSRDNSLSRCSAMGMRGSTSAGAVTSSSSSSSCKEDAGRTQQPATAGVEWGEDAKTQQQQQQHGWRDESLEHLETVREMRGEELSDSNGHLPGVDRVQFCRVQLRKLKDAFRLRTRTLERGMAKVVKETSMALEDGSLKYMTDTLHSTRAAMQSLQSVMDEFTIQFDGRLSLVERNMSHFVTGGEHPDGCGQPEPLDVFFHFVVSYIARSVDGWRRLIQGLALPMDRECEVLRMVTKATTSGDQLCRLSRSMPDIHGQLADHLLVTDLSVCALSFVSRHLKESCGEKCVIKRVLHVIDDVFDDQASKEIVSHFVRLMSSVDIEGQLSESTLDKFCSLVLIRLKSENSASAAAAAELSRRLLLPVEQRISTPLPVNEVHPNPGRSSPRLDCLEKTLSTWRRKRSIDACTTLLEDAKDLLLALIDIGREDLACLYCRL